LAIAPDNPDVLMHLGRTMIELGRDKEAEQYLARFEKVRPQRVRGPWKQPGMIETASLPAAERTKREIERLRRDASNHPDDPELLFRLACLLLADGRKEDALTEFRMLLGRNAGTECGSRELPDGFRPISTGPAISGARRRREPGR
jgi:thioredoxin-like negative regulator of GroEL